MKKIAFIIFAGLLSFQTAVLAETAPSHYISDIQGEASVLRQGKHVPASGGMEILQGDVIETEKGAQVDLSLNGESGTRFLEATQCTIEKASDKDIRLNMTAGNLIANLKKKLGPDQTFEVETPTAVLAVRGTQFWGQVQTLEGGPRQSTFAVREGSLTVAAKASNAMFVLEAGQAIELPEGKVDPVVREATQGELDAIAQAEQIKIAGR